MLYSFPHKFPVTCHTDFIEQGSTFVAIKGQRYNGVDFIAQAIDLGASTIVVSNDAVLPQATQKKIEANFITLERVENPRQALAQLSAQALGYPARKLKIIGVTGTKGKTTTAFMIEHILKTAGFKTALVSTIHNKIGESLIPKNLTTPQPDYLQVFFAECVNQHIEWVVMEVSAQALSLERVYGIEFETIVFTNFSQEHGEFYTSQEEYFQAKCLIFKQLKNGMPSILNADDNWFECVLDYNKNQNSFSVSLIPNKGTIWADVIENSLYEGLVLKVYHTISSYILKIPQVIGIFNAYNSLMAAAAAISLGIDATILVEAFKTFASVPGRMQRQVISNGALAIIDYAHTPSSFDAVLSTLRQETEHLIVLFGAGGNRDKEKRPLMGKIAAQYADIVLLTTDNPRDEEPQDIIADILKGISTQNRANVIIELDRAKAIQKAYQCSNSKSIIVLLGKGPDEYQEVKGVKIPFSERAILASL